VMSPLERLSKTKREEGVQGKLFDNLENSTQPVPDRINESQETADRDRTLMCPDCNRGFSCTIEEYRLYEELGYTRPTRCPMCHLAYYFNRRKKKRGKR